MKQEEGREREGIQRQRRTRREGLPQTAGVEGLLVAAGVETARATKDGGRRRSGGTLVEALVERRGKEKRRERGLGFYTLR